MSNRSEQRCPFCNDWLHYEYPYRSLHLYCLNDDYEYLIKAYNKGIPGQQYIPDIQIIMNINGTKITTKEHGWVFDHLEELISMEEKNEYIRQLAKLDLFV